jgi:hypothetical protein
MPFAEEDLLRFQRLQHLLFCERKCALSHIERSLKYWGDGLYGMAVTARASVD